jgi:M6 family metalloprotease-like protein
LGASEYEVRVESPGGTPVIDTVTTLCWHHREDDAYVIDGNRWGWKWKVRAKVDGVWGPWSEEWTFDLEPLDSDCTGVPDFAHPDRPHMFIKDQWSCELWPLRPRIGEQPLLVILVEFPDSPHDPAHTRDFFEDVVFGDYPSVRGYFEEVSYGNYTITNAGMLGWYEAPHESDWYFDPGDHYQDLAADVVGIAIENGFPFGAFDADGDGEIVRDELAVLMILTDHTFLGLSFVLRTRYDQAVDLGLLTPPDEIIEVDTNATRVTASEGYPGTRVVFYCHELAHGLLGLLDLYGDGYGGDPASLFSIMAVSGSLFTPHLDPWAKIHLGWIEPIVVTETGYYDVRAVEEYPEAYILYNPARGPDEYFIVENRWPPASVYEATLPEQGLAIWHITEYYDDEPFDYDRGRKMIAMKWGADSTVANRNELWDGSDPDTAYDFTDDSLPRNARWADGSPSGIQITGIPEAGPVMRVRFSVPTP